MLSHKFPPFQSDPSHKSRRPRPDPFTSTTAKILRYQDMVPTEIWRLILEYLATLDLFSLYNTSTYMRAVAAPSLVLIMATKSLRLFFYQEYVRRIGIRFVFDHYDLEKDRVFFRPQQESHQHRFRSGLTLQNPQLEEVAVKSTGTTVEPHQLSITCAGVYSIQDRTASKVKHGVQQTSEIESSLTVEETLGPEEDPSLEPGVAQPASMATVATKRKRTVEERGFQGTKNFLDKTCPIHVKRTGLRTVDGCRYSFSPDYPWTLHYQVECQPLEPAPRSTLTTPVPEEGPVPSREGAQVTKKEYLLTSGGSGPRFLRATLFECSMNFLNPKRATRHIIGRWIEGKVQLWKRVLTGRRPASQSIHPAEVGTLDEEEVEEEVEGREEMLYKESSSSRVDTTGTNTSTRTGASTSNGTRIFEAMPCSSPVEAY